MSKFDNAVTFTSVSQMKVAVKNSGSHFFDHDTMRFFNSKIESPILSGRFFITSEYMEDPAEKRYTVRYFTQGAPHEMMESEQVGEFQQYATRAEAKGALLQAISDDVHDTSA